MCEGLITRCRTKDGKEEKSVLDFFVVCSRVLPYITKMIIDEKKQHILTNYKNVKRGSKATDTDHFTQQLDLKLELISRNLRGRRFLILRIKNLRQFLKK